MPSKYRITTNGPQFRVEERNVAGIWKNRFSFHFESKEAAQTKVRELEQHDAEKRHEWTVVEN